MNISRPNANGANIMQVRPLFWLTSVLLSLTSCAAPPLTPEQKAAIEAQRAERAAQLERESKEFEATVAARVFADPNAPLRPTDPGYPAARCISPPLENSVAALTFPAFGVAYDGVVCDNTEAGLKVLAWREWYCRGLETDSARVRDCATSWWRNGKQRKVDAPGKYGGYGGLVDKAVRFTTQQPGASIVFEPATWQPGISPSSQHPDRGLLVAGGHRESVRIALAYKVEVQRGSLLFGGIDTYYVLEGDWAAQRVNHSSTPMPEFVVSVSQGFTPDRTGFPQLFQFATNRGARIYAGTPQGPNDNFTKWGFRSVPQNAELLPDQSAAITGYRIWRITPTQPLSRGEYGLRKEWRRDGYLFFPFGVD